MYLIDIFQMDTFVRTCGMSELDYRFLERTVTKLQFYANYVSKRFPRKN